MREAINNNPKVQAGLIVGLLLAGVFLFMKMTKKPEAVPTDPAVVSATAAGVTGTGAGVAPVGAPVDPAAAAAAGAAGVSATPTAVPSAPAASGAVTPQALMPGPGMPADVAQAFARGNAIVLLIVKEGGTDDDLVHRSVVQISKPGVSVFVAPVTKIARYSRITQGAGVNRVPALIVVRPRSVSGDTPQATVSYGFRNAQSVVQAVQDALYRGKDDVPYYPG